MPIILNLDFSRNIFTFFFKSILITSNSARTAVAVIFEQEGKPEVS